MATIQSPNESATDDRPGALAGLAMRSRWAALIAPLAMIDVVLARTGE